VTDHVADQPHAADRQTQRRGATALSMSVAFSAIIGFATTLIWAATSAGYYWPRWVWLAGYAVVSVFAIRYHVLSLREGAKRLLIAHADATAALSGLLVLVWCFADVHAVFWPVWPIAVLATLLGAHAVIAYRNVLPSDSRERELSERVETLTRSRRGALDVQTAELRRIERDLHDGAQARLVALSMQLGRAEARLADDPETAALVRSAREEAGAAIAELRDLARGIAPPVLTDRGLVAAVQSLADRGSTPVTVTATDDRASGGRASGGRASGGLERLPEVVESAAYFVVAEALTNVAKHAPGATARVSIERQGANLVVTIADDGPGGADPNGLGLDGLRTRVEAVDGNFTVLSPAGGPTLIRAELPCAS
jgi:signal transduction histidine kinase